MKTNSNRRLFLKSGTIASCALLFSGKLNAASNFLFLQDENPDPKKLNYCGYKCPKDCQFLEASVKNDIELKKKAYETWKIKERYNVDFDEKTTFCFGCKNEDKPAGVVMTNCIVRECAIEKKKNACIECEELVKCDKDLWTRFPEFHKTIINMQNTYLESKA